MKYERLTKKKLNDGDFGLVLDEIGNVIVDRRLFEKAVKIHNRLADLEDKIEQGTLVDTETYFIVEENQWADGTCPKTWDCPYNNTMAKILIEQGYRKIHEGVDWLDGYKQGFKEGVQAVQIQAKEGAFTEFFGEPIIRASKIDEICKELTEVE